MVIWQISISSILFITINFFLISDKSALNILNLFDSDVSKYPARINFCCANEADFVQRLFEAGTEFPLVDRLEPMLKVANEMGIERLKPVYRDLK